MKRIHVIVTLVALALIMSSFSSLISAQTVWRDGEQFKVVNSNQVVLFNISNIPISVPKDAKDINVTIHARFRLLRAPDIVNARAFVCEVNSDNVVFTLSSSGSKRVIIKAYIEPNKLSSWNVTFCPEDICSNVLDVNITLMNVSPIDGSVNIANAYVVLSNFSTPLKALIPASNKVLIIAKYRNVNTGKIHNNTTTATSSPQPKPNFLRLGTGITWILLLILIPTIAFLFSEGDRRERGRVAGWSSVGVLFGLLGLGMSRREFLGINGGVWTAIVGFGVSLFAVRLPPNRRMRGFLVPVSGLMTAFGVSTLVVGNIASLIWIGVNPEDFFVGILLFIMVGGIAMAFWMVWGVDSIVVALFYILTPFTIAVIWPDYGFEILVLEGYAIVFIQSLMKAHMKQELNSIAGLKLGFLQASRILETLDTMYNLIVGAFIVPSAIVLAYGIAKGSGILVTASSGSLLSGQFQYIVLLYIGISILSVLILWTDDLTRPQNRRRLILQNAIAMLLIVLGIGGFAILGVNFGMNNGNPDLGVLWNWALRNIPQRLMPCLVFTIEGIVGAVILVLFNNRNQNQ